MSLPEKAKPRPKRKRPPVVARSGGAKFHVASTAAPDVSRCGVPLVGEPIPARSVPVEDRCGKGPCRVRWPGNLRAV